MSEMQRYPFTLAANGTITLACMGTKFNILSATGALTIALDSGGKLAGAVAGQGSAGREFTMLTLTDVSGAPNTGYIQVSDDTFINQVFSGNVAVTSNRAATTSAMASAQATVTSASTTILAANTNRQSLEIQNNDVTGIVYVQPSGAAATAAAGIKILPGQSWSPPGATPTTAITAIGSIASNANVIVTEG